MSDAATIPEEENAPGAGGAAFFPFFAIAELFSAAAKLLKFRGMRWLFLAALQILLLNKAVRSQFLGYRRQEKSRRRSLERALASPPARWAAP